jgi:YD repeat-containing protein
VQNLTIFRSKRDDMKKNQFRYFGRKSLKFLRKGQFPRVVILAALLTVGITVSTSAQTSARVNAGGAAFTGSQDQKWDADRDGTGGVAITTVTDIIPGGPDVAGITRTIPAALQPLYKSQKAGATLSYSLAMTNGTYDIDLLFAEIQGKNVGERKFDVSVEGNVALTDFDINQAASGINKAITKTVRVNITDGKLDIVLTGKVGEAALAGISARIPTSFGLGIDPTTPLANFTSPLLPGVILAPWALPGWADSAQPQDEGAGAGDSVNLATGAYSNCLGADMTVDNPYGPAPSLTRVYNSTRAAQGVKSPGMSEGWSCNWDTQVRTMATGNAWNDLALVYSNGSVERWTPKDGSNCLDTQQGVPYVVSGVRAATNDQWSSLKVRMRDETQWEFTPSPTDPKVYWLTKIYNRAGRFISVERDATGKVTSIKNDNAGGQVLMNFTYVGDTLASVTDEVRSRQVNYTFENSTLTKVSREFDKGGTVPSNSIVYTYKTINTKPFLSGIQVESFGYKGNVINIPHNIEYDTTTGKVVYIQTARGDKQEYSYVNGQTTVSTKDKGITEIGTYTKKFGGNFLAESQGLNSQNSGPRVEYNDARHPLLPTDIITMGKDSNNADFEQRSTLTYDEWGNTLSENVPINGKRLVTLYRYDYTTDPLCGAPWGRLIEVKTGNQTSTLYEYYTNGMIKAVEEPAPGTSGTGARVRTEYTYTATGNIETIKTPAPNDATGVITTRYKYTDDVLTGSLVAYSISGQVERLEKPLAMQIEDTTGAVVSDVHYRYNAKGELIQTIQLVAKATTATTGVPTVPAQREQISVTDYTYTLGGKPKTVIGPAVNGIRTTTTYAYDGDDGPLKTVTISDGTKTRVVQTKETTPTPPSSAPITAKRQLSRDAYGRVTAVKDGNGQTLASATYDKDGNLQTLKRNIINSAGGTSVSFHPWGGVKSRTDAKNNTTNYVYAPDDNRLLSVSFSDGKTPNTSYEYDDYGRMTKSTDTIGGVVKSIISYTYDDLDNILSTTTKYDALSEQTVSYTYNKDGSRKTMSLGTPAGIGTVKTISGTSPATFAYTYDALGNITLLKMPWVGGSARYVYDQANRLIHQRGVKSQTDYTYDERGRLTKLANVSTLTSAITTPTEGVQTSIAEPNPFSPLPMVGLSTVTTQTVTPFTGTVPVAKANGEKNLSIFQNMEYDIAGNRTKVDILLPAQGYSPKADGTILYNFDDKDRLTKEVRTFTEPRFSKYNYDFGYTYDFLGNLIELGNQGKYIKKIERDALNRVAGTGIAYDPQDGKVTKKGDNVITMDAAGHVTDYGTSLKNTWRGDGLRGSKQGTRKAYFLYDGDKVIAELDQNGALRNTYAYGPMGLLQRHDNTTGNYLEYTFDPHGNRTESHRQADIATASANTALYTMMGSPFFLSSSLSGGPMPIVDPVGAFGQAGQYSDEETRTTQDPAGLAMMGMNMRIAELDGTGGRFLNSPYSIDAMDIADQMPYLGMLNVAKGVGNAALSDLMSNVQIAGYAYSILDWTGRQQSPLFVTNEGDSLADEIYNNEATINKFDGILRNVLDLHPDPGYEWYGKLGETSYAVGQFAGQALGGVANFARSYSMSAARGCNQSLLGKCFIAGTTIQMADGTTKSIEQVQVGDKVLSLNIKTGKVEEKSVLKTYVREAEHLHAISAGNETLYTTDGHPFLTSHGYVNAEDLTTGTSLVTRVTQPTPTTSLATPVGGGVNWNGTSVFQNAKFDQPSIFFGHKGNGSGYTVYNFEVEDNHNYFVGRDNGGICVHNADDYMNKPAGYEGRVVEFDTVPYRPAIAGFENHHGVMDKWASVNVPRYTSRAGHNPTMALTPLNHDGTKAVYREWLNTNYGRPVGVSPDWAAMTEKEAIQMSESMFDRANVPISARRTYYKAYRTYVKNL